jgi:phosphomevalonate kinase
MASGITLPIAKSQEIVVILISGKRLSGKDTTGLLIAQQLNHYFNIEHVGGHPGFGIVNVNFADAIKREYAKKNNIDLDRLLSDRQFKESHRDALIKFGREARANHKGIWVEALFDGLNLKTNPQNMIVVISDLRLFSEIIAVPAYFRSDPQLANTIKLKIIVVRVECTNEVRQLRGWRFEESKDNDLTELELDDLATGAGPVTASLYRELACFPLVIQNSTNSIKEYEDQISLIVGTRVQRLFGINVVPADISTSGDGDKQETPADADP